MQKDKAIERLKKMLGKDWLYMGTQYNFINYLERSDKVEISTDKGLITQKNEELAEFMLDCSKVDSKDVVVMQNIPTLQASNSDTISFLRDTLKNNIDLVQKDPKYIAQATQINKDVYAIIDLAKTEIDMVRLVKGVK